MTSSRDDIIQHLINGGATLEQAVSMLPMYETRDHCTFVVTEMTPDGTVLCSHEVRGETTSDAIALFSNAENRWLEFKRELSEGEWELENGNILLVVLTKTDRAPTPRAADE